MEQLVTLRSALARLGTARLAAMGAVAVAVLLAVAWIATRSGEPMGLLYAGLDPAEGGRIVQKLEEMKIPYAAQADGGTLLVPVSQVARIRMELAASGLPHQAGAGYELLDAQSPMNMTSFMQHVQRLRALEGELARTIVTLDGVKSARVHIVLPERESFTRSAPPPTASVAITMIGAGRPSMSQAAAIRLLVAGAVPRLRQEDVSVIDPSGVVLAAEGGSAALASGRLAEMQAALEQRLQRSVLTLLEPVVGEGRIRTVVSVELESARETSREERFDPLSQVERSRQTQVDQEKSDETQPGNTNNTVSVGQNLPNGAQGAAPAGAAAASPGRTTSSSTRNGQTINYEISSTRSERLREPGDVRRLTVAVLLDGKPTAYPQAELDRLAGLVKDAVGFNDKRGDRVTVQVMRFAAGEPAGSGANAATPAAAGMNWPVIAGGALLLLLAGGGVAATMRRRRIVLLQRQRAAEQVAQLPDTPADEDMVLLAHTNAPVPASAVAGLAALVDDHPDDVLAVVRAWIAEDGAAR